MLHVLYIHVAICDVFARCLFWIAVPLWRFSLYHVFFDLMKCEWNTNNEPGRMHLKHKFTSCTLTVCVFWNERFCWLKHWKWLYGCGLWPVVLPLNGFLFPSSLIFGTPGKVRAFFIYYFLYCFIFCTTPFDFTWEGVDKSVHFLSQGDMPCWRSLQSESWAT